jgi:hypothetical protein
MLAHRALSGHTSVLAPAVMRHNDTIGIVDLTRSGYDE